MIVTPPVHGCESAGFVFLGVIFCFFCTYLPFHVYRDAYCLRLINGMFADVRASHVRKLRAVYRGKVTTQG